MINIILYDNNSLEKSSVHVLVNILVGCLTNDFNWLYMQAYLLAVYRFQSSQSRFLKYVSLVSTHRRKYLRRVMLHCFKKGSSANDTEERFVQE